MAKKPGGSRTSGEEREIAEMVEAMIRVLESQRILGDGSYPPTLEKLAELCELRASDTRIDKAAGKAVFKQRAVVAWSPQNKPAREAPVFLATAAELDEAAEEVAPAVLIALLKQTKESSRADTVANLKKKLTEKIKKPFQTAINRGIERRSLPPEIGWLKYNSTKILFLLSAVESSGAPAPVGSNGQGSPAPRNQGMPSVAGSTHGTASAIEAEPRVADTKSTALATDFASAFRAAFDRLDRQNRSTNFVRLLDLRRALSEFDRERFDEGLRQLRIDDEFTLDSHEGRHGPLSEEEREAGVQEAGSLLVYVSRRS